MFLVENGYYGLSPFNCFNTLEDNKYVTREVFSVVLFFVSLNWLLLVCAVRISRELENNGIEWKCDCMGEVEVRV